MRLDSALAASLKTFHVPSSSHSGFSTASPIRRASTAKFAERGNSDARGSGPIQLPLRQRIHLTTECPKTFRGPRAYDASGLPLHVDNESTFKERFFVDKSNPNLLHDVITVTDHALTRPWTVDKTFRRNPDPQKQRVQFRKGLAGEHFRRLLKT